MVRQFHYVAEASLHLIFLDLSLQNAVIAGTCYHISTVRKINCDG